MATLEFGEHEDFGQCYIVWHDRADMMQAIDGLDRLRVEYDEVGDEYCGFAIMSNGDFERKERQIFESISIDL